jgi:pyruvate kinase
MLSGETANGEHPIAAVNIMAETCCEAESAIVFDTLYQAVRNSSLKAFGLMDKSESIASSAVKTAIDINASGIIVCSESGTTARQVAKFRSGRHVTVLTTSERVARQCYGVLKGCDAVVMPSLEHVEHIISAIIEDMKHSGKAKSGTPIVIVQGMNPVQGATNTMRIQYA